MPLISLVVTLIIVGVLLWLANTYLAEYMDAKILKIINIVVVIAVIIWLLQVFGVWGHVSGIRVG